MLNNLTNFSPLIKAGKIKTLLEASDLFTIGVRNPNFGGHYEPELITATNLANSIAPLLPFPFTLTTTGTSGVSTLIGTVLNIPNYSGGSLPAWLEYDATDLTIWNNGHGNEETNTSYGDKALRSNTTGQQNTAIGWQALIYNTTGFQNTAIGSNALFSNVTGFQNTGIGRATLFSNTTGNYNTAVGDSALLTNTADNNTAVGMSALQYNTTGYNNTHK